VKQSSLNCEKNKDSYVKKWKIESQRESQREYERIKETQHPKPMTILVSK